MHTTGSVSVHRRHFLRTAVSAPLIRQSALPANEPPRPLEVIETDIKRLEGDIMKMLKEVTA